MSNAHSVSVELSQLLLSESWQASFLGGHHMALVYSLVDIHCSEKGPYFRARSLYYMDLFDLLGTF